MHPSTTTHKTIGGSIFLSLILKKQQIVNIKQSLHFLYSIFNNCSCVTLQILFNMTFTSLIIYSFYKNKKKYTFSFLAKVSKTNASFFFSSKLGFDLEIYV